MMKKPVQLCDHGLPYIQNVFFFDGEKAGRVVKLFKRINLGDFGPGSPLNNMREEDWRDSCLWLSACSKLSSSFYNPWVPW